jgi:hypothetical protein
MCFKLARKGTFRPPTLQRPTFLRGSAGLGGGYNKNRNRRMIFFPGFEDVPCFSTDMASATYRSARYIIHDTASEGSSGDGERGDGGGEGGGSAAVAARRAADTVAVPLAQDLRLVWSIFCARWKRQYHLMLLYRVLAVSRIKILPDILTERSKKANHSDRVRSYSSLGERWLSS